MLCTLCLVIPLKSDHPAVESLATIRLKYKILWLAPFGYVHAHVPPDLIFTSIIVLECHELEPGPETLCHHDRGRLLPLSRAAAV